VCVCVCKLHASITDRVLPRPLALESAAAAGLGSATQHASPR